MHYVALNSLLMLTLLWVLVFWFYWAYRVELFRQNMFKLRDELFDAAREGLIAFDDPAYSYLRSRMNGFIRFGHRLSILQFIGFTIASAKFPESRHGNESWNCILSRHTPDTRKRLEYYMNEMHMLVIDQCVFGSPPITLTVIVPIVFYLAMKTFSTNIIQAFKEPLERLDCAALIYRPNC
jgi:hypothetical protein